MNISIVDDGTNEGREEFEALLTALEDDPSVTVAPNRTEVVIEDDDLEQAIDGTSNNIRSLSRIEPLGVKWGLVIQISKDP